MLILLTIGLATGCSVSRAKKNILAARSLAETLEIGEGSVSINGRATTTTVNVLGEFDQLGQYRVIEYNVNFNTVAGHSVTVNNKKAKRKVLSDEERAEYVSKLKSSAPPQLRGQLMEGCTYWMEPRVEGFKAQFVVLGKSGVILGSFPIPDTLELEEAHFWET